jgi:hypothetical protein
MQLIKCRRNTTDGVTELRAYFNKNLEDCLRSFREEEVNIQRGGLQKPHQVMNRVGQLQNDFLYVSNSIFKSIEGLQIDLRDTRPMSYSIMESRFFIMVLTL